MKKVIAIFSFVLLAGATQLVNAQSAPTTPTEVTQEDEKVKITAEELPEAVKKTLEGADYQGWTIDAVYHNKTKDIYELSVKKGAETAELKFGKDGSIIE